MSDEVVNTANRFIQVPDGERAYVSSSFVHFTGIISVRDNLGDLFHVIMQLLRPLDHSHEADREQEAGSGYLHRRSSCFSF